MHSKRAKQTNEVREETSIYDPSVINPTNKGYIGYCQHINSITNFSEASQIQDPANETNKSSLSGNRFDE